eukprot:550121_1
MSNVFFLLWILVILSVTVYNEAINHSANFTILTCGDIINLDMMRQKQNYTQYYLTVNVSTTVNIDTSNYHSILYASISCNDTEVGNFDEYNMYGLGYETFPMLQPGIEYQIMIKEDYMYGNGSNVSYDMQIQCFPANNKYILIKSELSTYDAAEAECERLFETTLATVLSLNDIDQVTQLFNQSGNVSISAWIGRYRDVRDGSKWLWIDNSDYSDVWPFELYRPKQEWNLSSTTQPDDILKSQDIHRIGTVISLVGESVKFQAYSANSKHYWLCNAPGYEYTYPILDFSGDIINEWRPSDLFLDGANSFAFWNNTIFIIDMNRTAEAWMIQENELHWSHSFDFVIFNYQQNISNKTAHNYWYTQYKSSFYLLISYVIGDVIQFELTQINLENNVINQTLSDPHWQLILFDPDIYIHVCMVADQSSVYLLRASVMLIYDLETHQWFQTDIWEDIPTACAIDKNEQFIYIFGLWQDVLYKYEIMSKKLIIVNEVNLCSNAVGTAITAANGKIYLHGCYVASWKTLIFDSDREKFENFLMGYKEYILRSGFTTMQQGSKLVVVDDNVIALVHSKNYSLSYGVYYSWTEFIAINFDDTKTIIWPSDGIDFQYYISSIYEIYSWRISGYNIQVTSNDTENYIDGKVVLNTSYCDCTPYLCSRCLEHFDLTPYLSLHDNHIDNIDIKLNLSRKPGSRYLERGFIANPVLNIELNRCVINILDLSARYGKADSVIVPLVKYEVNELCYSRVNVNFLFDVNIDKYDHELVSIIDTQFVNISIIDNQTHICHICGYEYPHYCRDCNLYNFSLVNEKLQYDQGILNVSCSSNMVDLVVDVSKYLGMEFCCDTDDTLQGIPLFGTEFKILFWSAAAVLLFVICIVIYCYRKNKRLKRIREQYAHYIA